MRHRSYVLHGVLAAVALGGCATVLGIDDIPEPDNPASESGHDGAGPPSDGALQESDGSVGADLDADTPDTTPLDVSAPPAPDLDTGIADAGALLTNGTITGTLPSFNPAAVAWDEGSGTLYIADNAAGGQILAWKDGLTTPNVIVSNVLGTGETFGQLSIATTGHLIVPGFTSGGGHVYKILPQGTSVPMATGSYKATAAATSGIWATGTATKDTTVEQFSNEEDGTGVVHSVASAPTGIVAIADTDLYLFLGGVIIHATGPTFENGTTLDSAMTPEPGYMILGPPGKLLLQSGDVLRAVSQSNGQMSTPIPTPNGLALHDIGAFAYDRAHNRLFVPEGTAPSRPGEILVFTWGN